MRLPKFATLRDTGSSTLARLFDALEKACTLHFGTNSLLTICSSWRELALQLHQGVWTEDDAAPLLQAALLPDSQMSERDGIVVPAAGLLRSEADQSQVQGTVLHQAEHGLGGPQVVSPRTGPLRHCRDTDEASVLRVVDECLLCWV